MKHVAPFVNPLTTRLTPVKDIPYFVTDNFLRTYYRDRYQLAQVERMVENAYMHYLIAECKNQIVYKRHLENEARKVLEPEERERRIKAAADFEKNRCVELGELFPNWAERTGQRVYR